MNLINLISLIVESSFLLDYLLLKLSSGSMPVRHYIKGFYSRHFLGCDGKRTDLPQANSL
jgi:hypothetical protein